ncbi:hypothetical protein ACFOEY_01780 [Paracandidimonas soli]|uniref:hypothetical protein n=1 Tax=Paracandidimonas soli TaxID=1917182 RepID=UPI00360A5B25
MPGRTCSPAKLFYNLWLPIANPAIGVFPSRPAALPIEEPVNRATGAYRFKGSQSCVTVPVSAN